MPIDYKIKLKKESGFVAIVSQYGAIQYGKFEESDFVQERKTLSLASNQGETLLTGKMVRYFTRIKGRNLSQRCQPIRHLMDG